MAYSRKYLEYFPDFKSIYFVNDDMWWSEEDSRGYGDQFESNKDPIGPVLPLLKGNSVAVQAGANCGWVTREVAKHFSDVYTFEPDALSFLCVCMNLPQDNVHKFQACLGSTHETVKINTDCRSDWGSGADHVEPNPQGEAGSVPTILIDDLNLNACDFIQLDLEGYEYFALEGAKNTIAKFKPVLQIEVAHHARYGVSLDQIKEFMKQYGYENFRPIGVGGVGGNDWIAY